MEAEDAKELHQDYLDTHLKAQPQQHKGKEKNKGAQASGGGSKRKKGSGSVDAAAAAEAAPLPPLSLGTELLEEDEGLAQVVAIALMQVWESHGGGGGGDDEGIQKRGRGGP